MWFDNRFAATGKKYIAFIAYGLSDVLSIPTFQAALLKLPANRLVLNV